MLLTPFLIPILSGMVFSMMAHFKLEEQEDAMYRRFRAIL